MFPVSYLVLSVALGLMAEVEAKKSKTKTKTKSSFGSTGKPLITLGTKASIIVAVIFAVIFVLVVVLAQRQKRKKSKQKKNDEEANDGAERSLEDDVAEKKVDDGTQLPSLKNDDPPSKTVVVPERSNMPSPPAYPGTELNVGETVDTTSVLPQIATYDPDSIQMPTARTEVTGPAQVGAATGASESATPSENDPRPDPDNQKRKSKFAFL